MSPKPDEVKARSSKVRYFGDYELLEEIAHRSGVVYRARQVSLNREVALKLVPAGALASLADMQRFRAEVESAASLDHPNIVPIYEVGEHDGQHYFSMKLVDGDSLAEEPGRFVEKPREAAALVATMARAVHYAHQRGILHRDLKPANILMRTTENTENTEKKPEGSGFLLFSVFSVSSVVDASAFISPEQTRGSQTLTTAADVYGLGAILYECLTGRPPFEGDTLRKVLEDAPVQPRQLNPRVGFDLEAICLKCLEKEPEKRYVSAAALAEDLERWRQGFPILALPASRWNKAAKWAKRHPAKTMAYLSVCFAVMSGLAGMFVLLNERARQVEIAVEQHAETERTLARTERLLYDLRISSAAHEWQANRIDRARQQLDACPAALRGWEWSWLHDQLRTDLLSLAGTACIAYRADGAQVASADAAGKLHVWDATGTEVATLPGHTGGVNSVAFSPNGQLLASGGKDALVRIWDLATQRERRVLRGHTAEVRCVSFSPDGTRLASCGGAPKEAEEVKLWDVAADLLLLDLRCDGDTVQHVAFSPDGARLVSASAAAVRVWDAVAGKKLIDLPGQRCAVFSPDGERIAALAGRSVTLSEAATGKLAGSIVGPRPFRNALAFSPDGASLATTSDDQTVTLWDVASGDESFTLRGDNGDVVALAFRPDGQRLAAVGRQVKVWDVARRPECRHLSGGATGLSFSSDGRLASAGPDLARIWEPATGRLSQGFTLQERTVSDVALSPDGRVLAVAEGREVTLRDTSSGRALRSLRGHDDTILRILFRPDGRQLASCSADRTVKFWADNGRLLFTLDRHDGSVAALAYRPDGRRLATGGSDGKVKVWDTETGEELRSFATEKGVSDIAFSSDGARLAWVAGGAVKVHHLDSDSEMPLMTDGVRSIAFQPESERLATVGINGAGLWDTATGQRLLSLPGCAHGSRIAFSLDGRRLAALTPDGIAVWGRDDWDRARASRRGDPDAERDRHRELAELLLRRRLWVSALFHLNRLLAERPRDGGLLALRGLANAGREDWSVAANDYRQAIEAGMSEPWVAVDEGLLLLRGGNRDGYRETCQGLVKRYAESSDAAAVVATIEACVLLSDAVKDFAPLEATLDRFLTRRPGLEALVPLRGQVLYRAGKHREALLLLEERLTRPESSGSVEEWLFLAMARQRLGRKAEALQAFDQAAKDIRRAESPTWQERLRRETLRHEAETLLGKE